MERVVMTWGKAAVRTEPLLKERADEREKAFKSYFPGCKVVREEVK